MKKIYVAATEQNAGKTTLCVGLYCAARRAGYNPCFIKPVGQRYLVQDGEQVDEDAVLFKRALGADGALKVLSPVTIPRGFTAEYVFHRDRDSIRRPILEAVRKLEREHDVLIVEGTGHAGVGSVIDASNASVAQLLEAKCVIIAGGGIGRCIDEICLNRALFERSGVPIVGAVINKVLHEKYDRVGPAVRQGLANQGVECLGVIPYEEELSHPTLLLIKEELSLGVLCAPERLDNRVTNIIVAAMSPQNMVEYLTSGCLVVVPGDRVDNILACVNAHLLTRGHRAPQIAGLLLTGGFVPPQSIVNILCRAEVPALLTDQDTASAAFQVRSLVPKITPRDRDKISLAEQVVRAHVDVGRIFNALGLEPGQAPSV